MLPNRKIVKLIRSIYCIPLPLYAVLLLLKGSILLVLFLSLALVNDQTKHTTIHYLPMID